VPTFKIDKVEKPNQRNNAAKTPLGAANPNKSMNNVADVQKTNEAAPQSKKAYDQQNISTNKSNVSKPAAPKPVSQPDFKRPPTATNNARSEIKIFKDPAPVQPTSSKIHARGVNSKQAEANATANTNANASASFSTATPPAPTTREIRSPTPSSKSGLRPLLLRAESAQGLRAPAKLNWIDGTPLTSTPTKKSGQAVNPSRVAGNNNSIVSPSRVIDSRASIRSSATPKKGAAVNRVSSVAQTRDSKELRSPESIKTFKSAKSGQDNKLNNDASPMRVVAPPARKTPPKENSGVQEIRSSLFACESAQFSTRPVPYLLIGKLIATRSNNNVKDASPPPFSHYTVSVPSNSAEATETLQSEVPDRKSRLSKQRPSVKSQKSSAALSFASLSSSFKGTRGKSLDGRQHAPKDLVSDYAIVERDGRVSFDGGKRSLQRVRALADNADTSSTWLPVAVHRPTYQQVDLHIRCKSGDKQGNVQERIISPQAQRAFGESVQQEVTLQRERSFATRSNSISSMKVLPAVPLVNYTETSTTVTVVKIRKSLAPSFTEQDQTYDPNAQAYDGIEGYHSSTVQLEDSQYRSNSRQSSASQDDRSQSRQSAWSNATYGRPAFHNHKTMPSISVSNSHSSACHSNSSKHIRSCWSPETVPSEETCESVYSEEKIERDEDEGDDTIHAAPVPEIRRISGVFTRSPRAESIYQR
jgi:hypothetical protein